MAVQDDIAAERQRLTERLARIDAERQKLVDQIADLDAAKRVLSRLSPTAAAPRGHRRGAATAEGPAATAPRQGRGRQIQRTAEVTKRMATGRRQRAVRGGRQARQKPEVPLSDAALRAVEAPGNGTSAEQIRAYLSERLGMQVRPNHLGMALQRHRRAGRLQQDDRRWSIGQIEEQAAPSAEVQTQQNEASSSV
jgi:hypothetical protein